MLRAEFGAAVMLLTRLPAGWLIGDRPYPVAARCLWAYPLVGALVGAACGAVFTLCRGVAMPPLLAAAWTLGASALLTGALHEDGLADVADGFGGGHSRSQKLRIMRDSHVGSYGVFALVVAAAVRIVALAAVPRAVPALIAAGALSRAAIAAPATLPPARDDGLGAGLREIGWRWVPTACLGAAIGLAALPFGAAAGAIAVACVAALAVAALARVQIGGFTGDVLGACAVVTDCAVLSWLACLT